MKKLLGVLLSYLAITGTANASLIIDNTADLSGTIGPFGYPDTSTYGEAFHTDGTNNFMNSFSMELIYNGSSGGLYFKGYIGTWNGSEVSSLLYSSPTTYVTDQGGAFTFTTNIQLQADTQYIAFLSTYGLAQPALTSFPFYLQMPSTWNSTNVNDSNPFTDGFFFKNRCDMFECYDLISSPWDTQLKGGDAALIAEFSETGTPSQPPTSDIPEPASLALMGLGLAGLGFSRRKSMKQ